MSVVKVVAIEPCNQYKPGDKWQTSEREAAELIKLGLVKMAVPPHNKMAPEPANKANPSSAAGEDAQLFASPAAPASQRPTLHLPQRGNTRGRPRGK